MSDVHGTENDATAYCGAEYGEVRNGECECPRCIAQKDVGRSCDWCGKPAPEGAALLSIWWADYECCSMECVTLAETEAS